LADQPASESLNALSLGKLEINAQNSLAKTLSSKVLMKQCPA
jgi:hypothetical protein